MTIEEAIKKYKHTELVNRCISLGMSVENAESIPDQWLFAYYWEETHRKDMRAMRFWSGEWE